jgi:hypothetical protein
MMTELPALEGVLCGNECGEKWRQSCGVLVQLVSVIQIIET